MLHVQWQHIASFCPGLTSWKGAWKSWLWTTGALVCASNILFCSGRNKGCNNRSTAEGHRESQSGSLCCFIAAHCWIMWDQIWTWQDRLTPNKQACCHLLPMGICIALASLTKRVQIDAKQGSLLWALACLFNYLMLLRASIHSVLGFFVLNMWVGPLVFATRLVFAGR